MTTPAPKCPLDILQKRQNLEKHDTRPKRKTAVFNGGSFSLAQLKIMPAARPGQEKTGTCFFQLPFDLAVEDSSGPVSARAVVSGYDRPTRLLGTSTRKRNELSATAMATC